MWLRDEDLLGLVIGLALGGAALYLFLPRIEAARAPGPPPPQAVQPARQPTAPPGGPPSGPHAAQPTGPPAIRAATPAPPVAQRIAPPDPDVAMPVPAPLPAIAYPDIAPGSPGVRALPAVVGPAQPPKTHGTAGTGFFIAEDGSLLTAAHVGTECTRTAILSNYV